jgi:dihydrofolate reductase
MSQQTLTILSTISANGVIGNNGNLAFDFPDGYFDRIINLTNGYPVIMGKNTYDIFKGRLKAMENIVVSDSLAYSSHREKHVFRSLPMAIKYAKSISQNQFILGGQRVFQDSIQLCDKMNLTWLNSDYPGDEFFPSFNNNDWEVIDKERHFDYSIYNYNRIVNPKNLKE